MTAEDRILEFEKDLKEVLKKHNAELEVEYVTKHYTERAVINVTLCSIDDDDNVVGPHAEKQYDYISF